MATQVGQIFALKEGPGMTATDALAAYLGRQGGAADLDNCEHVLDAAAALADRLVSSCPALRVLATSRQPLDLPGRGGLAGPVAGGPRRDDRAMTGRRGSPGWQPARRCSSSSTGPGGPDPASPSPSATPAAVAEICRRLDGIPLAIELAAARVRVFTPAQIAAGLNQRFELLTGAPRTALPRQQTLEASVDWSHHLLTDVEQTVFRRLAVFAGGFDYDAAEAVCAGGDRSNPTRCWTCSSLLVDKSLVHVDDSAEQARYRLLETIRLLRRPRLDHAGEDTETEPGTGTTTWPSPRRPKPNWRATAKPNGCPARRRLSEPAGRPGLEPRPSRRRGACPGWRAALSLFWAYHGPNTEGRRGWMPPLTNPNQPIRAAGQGAARPLLCGLVDGGSGHRSRFGRGGSESGPAAGRRTPDQPGWLPAWARSRLMAGEQGTDLRRGRRPRPQVGDQVRPGLRAPS